MEKVSLERLPLLNLQGEPVRLEDCFETYLFLIFLRHLA